MGRSILMALTLIQLSGLGVLAWAGGDRERREPASISRMDAKRDLQASIKGILSCELPEENAGEACILKLTAESGEIFLIPEHQQAMRMFQAGRKLVRIDGTKVGDTLRISSIKAIN